VATNEGIAHERGQRNSRMNSQETHASAAPVDCLLSGHGVGIPLFKVFMPESVMPALREVLFCGYIGEGPRAEEFERQLAPWVGNDNVLALNNGTAAIYLALRLAGVGPGDEVITTPMTCVATNMPILAHGARIVWADIDPWTGNVDPDDVARKITGRTKAILVVHWGGYPCELAELRDIAGRHGIRLIEDACHAFGSTYRGRPVGADSDFVCFSFQAIKEMTTVDGGALTCREGRDADRGRVLRWYGINRRTPRTDYRCEQDILEAGYKFHMNDVTATIGLEQLKHVGETIRRHRTNAARFDTELCDLKSVSLLRYQTDRTSSYWLYTLRARDCGRFAAAMRQAEITVSKVHARNDAHTVFREFRTPLPGVDEFSAEHVCIPVGWWLGENDLQHIVASVRRFDLTEDR
jgi:perosamine synthetase